MWKEVSLGECRSYPDTRVAHADPRVAALDLPKFTHSYVLGWILLTASMRGALSFWSLVYLCRTQVLVFFSPSTCCKQNYQNLKFGDGMNSGQLNPREQIGYRQQWMSSTTVKFYLNVYTTWHNLLFAQLGLWKWGYSWGGGPKQISTMH